MLGWPESCRCEAVSAITKFVFQFVKPFGYAPIAFEKKQFLSMMDAWEAMAVGVGSIPWFGSFSAVVFRPTLGTIRVSLAMYPGTEGCKTFVPVVFDAR